MEDRYLFKAKRLDNGEWIIGSLIQNPFFKGVRSWISSEQEDKTRLRSISRTQALWNSIEVDTSTICQCTGLKDKNNNLIWENDIAKFDVYYYEKLQSSTISQIKWCNELCALSLVVNDRGTRGTLGHLMDLNKEIEVIGNIFDNPELINKREKTYCKDDNDYER